MEASFSAERSLLKAQLADLDHWVSEVRNADTAEVRGGSQYHVLPARESDDRGYAQHPDEASAANVLERVLRAQCHELANCLIEARLAITPSVRSTSESEEELLFSLRWERGRAEYDADPKHNLHERAALQRLKFVQMISWCMKDAAVLQRSALDAVRSLTLKNAEDFSKLRKQLQRTGEVDSMYAQKLMTYTPTDVAVSFACAIEGHRRVQMYLHEAIRAQDALRESEVMYEQLVACDASAALGSDMIVLGPAARLLSRVEDGFLQIEGLQQNSQLTPQAIQFTRARKLLAKNRALWGELLVQWQRS